MIRKATIEAGLVGRSSVGLELCGLDSRNYRLSWRNAIEQRRVKSRTNCQAAIATGDGKSGFIRWRHHSIMQRGNHHS
jgi:hypothetical protein